MFQFPGFACLATYYVFNIVGCPIRKFADQFVCANPRNLSQLITSFFASESLGIPHTPLLCLLYFLLFINELFNVVYLLIYFNYYCFSRISFSNMSMNVWRIATDNKLTMTFTLLAFANPSGLRPPKLASASEGGEYRSRTDDLLRARQAL